MKELKPNWRIAQQISRRHSLISLAIMMPLSFCTVLVAIITLKILGYAHSGVVLKDYILLHHKLVLSIYFFIQLVPVNYYAIKRLLASDFPKFHIKIISNDPPVAE